MLNRIISVIMSFLISATGVAYSSLNSVIDSVSEMIFGLPLTAQAIKADFLNEITDSDVVELDKDTAYVKNKIAVFIDGEMSFFEKRALFKSCSGTLVGWSAPADIYVIRYPDMTYDETVEKCKCICEKDGVALAMPVLAYKTDKNMTPNDTFGNDSEDLVVWDEKKPGGNNWWLEAICARQAWDYSSYFSKINIGIADAGFQLDHPELAGKISFPNSRLAGRNAPDSHGTHVAGIIGARQNNGVGISGICENSQMICIDWMPDFLQYWNADLAIFFGFSALVKAGAKVINFSLGTSASKTSNSSAIDERLYAPMALSLMMSSLLSKGYDFVAVQSAGNGDFFGNPLDAENNGYFSAVNSGNIFTGFNSVSAQEILDRIIIVGSAEVYNETEFIQSDFSNVGSSIDISAPGKDVYSCSINSDYQDMSGTSMSAPIVTGVASLVWSVNPSFKGSQVKEIVCTSSDKVAQINNDITYIHSVDLQEYPLVNAKLAVEEAIRRTYSVGTVEGKTDNQAVAEVLYGGVSHTVFSDGTYSFVAPEGSGAVQLLDSDNNVVSSFDITVTAGQTTVVTDDVSSEIPAA